MTTRELIKELEKQKDMIGTGFFDQELLEKYYMANENEEDTKEIETELYKNYGTDTYCPRCRHQLLVSDLKDYKYLCLNCNENFYGMEISESGDEK